MTSAHNLRAQQKTMPVIGFLGALVTRSRSSSVAAFHQGLGETGYVEGQNVAMNTAGPTVAMIGCPHWPPISSAARSRDRAGGAALE